MQGREGAGGRRSEGEGVVNERPAERENERGFGRRVPGVARRRVRAGVRCVSRKKIHTIRSGQCIRVNSRDCLGVRVCSDIDTEARSERALINVKKSPIFKPATPAGA